MPSILYLTAPISTQKEEKIRRGTRRKRKMLSMILKSAFMDMHEEKMRQVKYQNTEAQENVNVGEVPLFLLLMYLRARRASQIVGKSFRFHDFELPVEIFP
jgi:hypothetical protein